MSATNRGTKRIESDFYPTPLKSFIPLLKFLPKLSFIWEPACGDGRLVKELLNHGFRSEGNDLSYGYDFLKDRSRRECIVTNPPFSIAKEFIVHALTHCNEVYMLLRLNFLGSQERKGFWIENEPKALFVLSERPNFVRSLKCTKCNYRELIPIEQAYSIVCPICHSRVKSGSSDSCEYAWFYWGYYWRGIYHI